MLQKKNADEMAEKIWEYIHKAEKNEDNRKDLCLELASSFISCNVDISQDLDAILKEVDGLMRDVSDMVVGGILRYKLTGKNELGKIERD